MVNGTEYEITSDATVSAALLHIGYQHFRSSVAGTPRGPLCGMGICFECRVTIDGTAHVRSCMFRASTVAGTSRFVTLVCNLIEERIGIRTDRPARGNLGPCPDVCHESCCPSGRPVAFGEGQTG